MLMLNPVAHSFVSAPRGTEIHLASHLYNIYKMIMTCFDELDSYDTLARHCQENRWSQGAVRLNTVCRLLITPGGAHISVIVAFTHITHHLPRKVHGIVAAAAHSSAYSDGPPTPPPRCK